MVEETPKPPPRKVSRRDVLKAGTLGTLGLAFSRPTLDTIKPKDAFAIYAPQIDCCADVTAPPPGSAGPIIKVCDYTVGDPTGGIFDTSADVVATLTVPETGPCCSDPRPMVMLSVSVGPGLFFPFCSPDPAAGFNDIVRLDTNGVPHVPATGTITPGVAGTCTFATSIALPIDCVTDDCFCELLPDGPAEKVTDIEMTDLEGTRLLRVIWEVIVAPDPDALAQCRFVIASATIKDIRLLESFPNGAAFDRSLCP